MEWREFSAKTVEDAVLEAAIKLGTTRDNVEYEVISQGSSGFFGIGSKDAVIKARLKEEEEDILEEIKQDLKMDRPMERKPEKRPEKKPEPKPEKKFERPETKRTVRQEKEEKQEKQEHKEEQREKPEKIEKQEKPEKVEKPKTPMDDQVQVRVEEFLRKVFVAMELEVELRVLANKEEREISVELNGQDMGRNLRWYW